MWFSYGIAFNFTSHFRGAAADVGEILLLSNGTLLLCSDVDIAPVVGWLITDTEIPLGAPVVDVVVIAAAVAVALMWFCNCVLFSDDDIKLEAEFVIFDDEAEAADVDCVERTWTGGGFDDVVDNKWWLLSACADAWSGFTFYKLFC